VAANVRGCGGEVVGRRRDVGQAWREQNKLLGAARLRWRLWWGSSRGGEEDHRGKEESNEWKRGSGGAGDDHG
jgi:hypothetical protein